MYASLVHRSSLAAASILLAGTLLVGQTSSPPGGSQSPQPAAPQSNSDVGSRLATAARSAQAQKTHAKKVYTDEDIDSVAGPLPRLKMEGDENADDIVAAIAKYKASHTPEQTEDAVHRWYDEYDEQLAAAIQENLDVKTLRDENVTHGYELCQESGDYQQCEARRQAELRGARHDQVQTMSNSNLVVRIQHSFMKIRNGLNQNNLHYDWFKIRTTNNIDKY